MKLRRKLVWSLILVAVLLPLARSAPGLGATAGDFTLYSPTLGRAVTLSSLKGQPVVLNFWGSWCGPCRDEMPALNAVAGRLKDKFTLLAVGVAEPLEKSLKYLQDNRFEALVLLGNGEGTPDSGDGVAERYDVNSFPTTVFIDKAGVIQAVRNAGLTERSFLSYLRNIEVYP